jgi:hypothetical protein
VARPYPAFALAMPDLDPPDGHYAIRRNAETGGRKDVLAFGDPASDVPLLMVEIYRPGAEVERFTDATSEVAIRAAEINRVGPVMSAGEIASKFGRVSLAEFLAQPTDLRRRCLGFARAYEDPLVQIAGWYCNAGPEIIDRAIVGCALDRLTLVAAGSDPKVAELFARAEINRTFCRSRSQILAAARKIGWIEGKDFKLRGRLAGR